MEASLFSKNIKYIRAAYGLSQQAMADKIGLPQKTYAKYDEDKATPQASTLIAIKSQTNVSIDSMLTELLEDKYTHTQILQLLAKKGI